MNTTLTKPRTNPSKPSTHLVRPWDVAMDHFRRFFPVPCLDVHVDSTGKTMKYRMRGLKNVANYLRRAEVLIAVSGLPLSVKRHTWAIGEVVFEDNLIITYAPQN